MSVQYYWNMFLQTHYSQYCTLEYEQINVEHTGDNNSRWDSTESKHILNCTFPNEVSSALGLAFQRYMFDTFKKERSETVYNPGILFITLMCLINGTIAFLSVFGNGLVIWIVMISRKMKTVTNMYLVNLAFADVITGLVCIPFQFQAALLQRWVLPEFFCSFIPFLQVLCVNLSVFTLTVISLDRYRAVMNPLLQQTSKVKASILLLLVWGISLTIAAPTFMDRKIQTFGKPFNDYISLCRSIGLPLEFKRYYNGSLAVLQYFLPLLVISVVYIKMGVQLWGHNLPENCIVNSRAKLKNKKQAVKMLAVVVVLFAISWLPFQSYLFIQQFIPSINRFKYINIVFFCIHSLAMSNSCVNPFIYAIYNEKFQEECVSRFGCIGKCIYALKREKRTKYVTSSYRAVSATVRVRDCVVTYHSDIKQSADPTGAASGENSLQNLIQWKGCEMAKSRSQGSFRWGNAEQV